MLAQRRTDSPAMGSATGVIVAVLALAKRMVNPSIVRNRVWMPFSQVLTVSLLDTGGRARSATTAR